MKKARLTFTDDSDFDLFWAAYPRHDGKVAARRIWDRLQPSRELIARIIAALEWQRRLPRWQDPEFVPMARTYLYNARWEDEKPRNMRAVDLPSWREQCRELAHEPACNSADAHELRKLVAANGCGHPGVCQSHGQHAQRVADEQTKVAV
jgi:hypothetical protein